MESRGSNPRIYSDETGWYVTVRSSDEDILDGPLHKKVGKQHLMGPFDDRDKAAEWLEDFIAKHGTSRKTDDAAPDNTDT